MADWWVLDNYHNGLILDDKSEIKTNLILVLYCFILIIAVLADCGPLPDPPNGQVTLMPDTLEGSTATYTCDDGFLVAGTDTRICQSNGNWSNIEPTCDVSSLFPFGVSVGDQVVPPAFIGQSPPVVKTTFNASCPFFGVQEDTLYVRK